MSTPADAADLERIVESIADAEPVQWPETGDADGTELTERLDVLRRLEAVAGAYRGLHRDGGGGDGAVPRHPPAEPLFHWGGLAVLELVGSGSFGEVYRAFDPKLDREVALKLRREDRPGRRDLVAEARRLARVHHPNVVTVHGVDEHDGRIGLWTDLVDGVTLADQVRGQGPLGPREAASIALDLCGALAAIHGAGLVHGDVKPANVMRERGGRVVLMDFGSGTELGPDRGQGASPTFGTPVVMPPELLDGQPATPVADLYSVGVVLYFLVTGHYPVEAAGLGELLEKRWRGEQVAVSDRRPDLPAALVAVIARATHDDPSRRYPTAGSLRDALAGLFAADVDAAPSQVAPEPAAPGRRPRQWPLAALLVGALGLAAVLVLWWAPGLRSPADVAAPARPTFVAPELQLAATLYRDDSERAQPLVDGDAVRPGDRLYLEVEAEAPVHLYVLNEDQLGHVYLLFPLPGLAPGNPLPEGRRHRVPGAADGRSQDWVVTSAGGRERFMVVAARRALPEVESAVGWFERADAGRPVDSGSKAVEPGVTLRGIGGLASGRHGGSRLEALRAVLPELVGDEPIWVDEVVLANPVG